MIVAELEAFYSRPVAPTRRIALGSSRLPTEHPPGYGGILLAGVVARFAPWLDEDVAEQVPPLMADLRAGHRIVQPRLRHRFQTDRVGLQRCRHRLVLGVGSLAFQLDETRGTPAHHVLAALYAAAALPAERRCRVLDGVEVGLAWRAAVGHRFIAAVTGRGPGVSVSSLGDPVAWARGVLRLPEAIDPATGSARRPARADVLRAFRDHLRVAHPDHGGVNTGAAERIAELAEARRILLAAS